MSHEVGGRIPPLKPMRLWMKCVSLRGRWIIFMMQQLMRPLWINTSFPWHHKFDLNLIDFATCADNDVMRVNTFGAERFYACILRYYIFVAAVGTLLLWWRRGRMRIEIEIWFSFHWSVASSLHGACKILFRFE